jgi:hypothetical protein
MHSPKEDSMLPNDAAAAIVAPAPHAPGASATADLIFDSIYSGAIGGSVIALFFLVADTIFAQPLFTPSLIGTVLFTHAPPEAVTEVRLDMVAYMSIVHFASFGALGVMISLLCRSTGLTGRHPLLVAGVLFAILTGAFMAAGLVAMPGILGVIGVPEILLANASTALTMAFFLRWAHKADSKHI